MTAYRYLVTVECETVGQAEIVIAERLGCDEDYGFTYQISTKKEPLEK